MNSRLLYGCAAAATLVGFIWTSVDDREATPAPPQTASLSERPRGQVEIESPSAATRARSSRSPGGMPTRDTSARRRHPTPLVSPAAPSASTALGAAAQPPPASSDAVRARGAVQAVPVSVDPATPISAIGDPSAPPDEERPRSRGVGGAVLEKSGTPAVGLQVALRARRVFNGASGGSAAEQTASTDGRGRFAFGAVADGEYEISTEQNDRYERASALVRAGTDSVVLVVEPASDGSLSIRGIVESASGGVLEGVRVQAIGQSVAATTDARGAFALRVPAGARAEQTALQFRRAGYRDRRWAMSDGVRSNDHEVIANVRLEPEAAGVTVTGVVTSTGGAPVARAQVQLNSAARGRSYRAVSDGDGRFTLVKVEAGDGYRLWVRPQSGFKDGLLENVLVDAATQLAVELTPIGVATLKGRMVTPDGGAVPGFTMFLVTANAAGQRPSTVTSDGQGRFLVADLPEGRIALQTHAAPALSVSGIELSAAASDVTVVVDVGAHRLEGRLVTNDGEPAAGASVSLEWSAASGGVTSRSSRQTMTDADGNFVFTQLGGGVHVVSAALAGAGSVRLERSISSGMEPVQLTLPGKRGRQ